MKKVLITGVTGFAGSYLAELLSVDDQIEIFGTYLSDASLANIITVRERMNLNKIDLLDAKNVAEYIAKIRPDEIYHLAALTSPADSIRNPTDTMMNNITAEIHILDAVVSAELHNCRIQVTSSADIYGRVAPEDLPIDEDTPLRPLNPYAVSKIAQDYLGLQYFLSHKLQVVRVRPFNHIGPRQSPNFVVPAFAKQIAEIEKKGKEPIIKVGNLEAKKDFTDVRDMVKAYALIMEHGDAGDVYNIGSGRTIQIKELLEKLLSFSSKTIAVEEDQERFRPTEVAEFVCDSAKMQQITHWKPEISCTKTLEDTLNYWREQV